MYSEQKQNKNNDDNWPISIQHSVNRVAQNRAARDCQKLAWLAMSRNFVAREDSRDKIARENCRCDISLSLWAATSVLRSVSAVTELPVVNWLPGKTLLQNDLLCIQFQWAIETYQLNSIRAFSFVFYIKYTQCLKKVPTFKLPVICQILTNFQNFCTAGKHIKFATKSIQHHPR